MRINGFSGRVSALIIGLAIGGGLAWWKIRRGGDDDGTGGRRKGGPAQSFQYP
jgi:hypothetical protein